MIEKNRIEKYDFHPHNSINQLIISDINTREIRLYNTDYQW